MEENLTNILLSILRKSIKIDNQEIKIKNIKDLANFYYNLIIAQTKSEVSKNNYKEKFPFDSFIFVIDKSEISLFGKYEKQIKRTKERIENLLVKKIIEYRNTLLNEKESVRLEYPNVKIIIDDVSQLINKSFILILDRTKNNPSENSKKFILPCIVAYNEIKDIPKILEKDETILEFSYTDESNQTYKIQSPKKNIYFGRLNLNDEKWKNFIVNIDGHDICIYDEVVKNQTSDFMMLPYSKTKPIAFSRVQGLIKLEKKDNILIINLGRNPIKILKKNNDVFDINTNQKFKFNSNEDVLIYHPINEEKDASKYLLEIKSVKKVIE